MNKYKHTGIILATLAVIFACNTLFLLIPAAIIGMVIWGIIFDATRNKTQ
ncbi:MAG: hypothetical protein LBD35_05720 [Prevotellaceae bacterium]|jgi:hypothetical protein|nr:hypothetical protein [Prevotellaceae bacterium]